MKMKSVKAILIFLLLLAGVITGYLFYLFWKMKAPDHEKEGLLVENNVTAYYNMAETGIPAYAPAPFSLLAEEKEGRSKAL